MMDIIKGETPNGGVAAHISYLDEDMRPCDKKDAVNITIQEIDEKGKMIMETWGTVKPSKFKQNYNCPDDERLFKVIAEVHSQKDINTKTSIDDIKKRIRGE